jgi:prohibitin 2
MSQNPFRQAVTKANIPGLSPKNLGFGVGFVVAGVGLSALAYNSVYTVSGGEKAIVFSRWSGVRNQVVGEGMHFKIPWLHQPHIFNVRTRPTNIASMTGSKDLQMVNITLRVLTKPHWEDLPKIYKRLGHDYDQRVLPSVVNEVLKGVVARFNAGQLITERELISNMIQERLRERVREFFLDLDDVSITHLTFSPEYTAAVEAKQVAQQEAERAKFVVEKAQQDKRSLIIKAQGDAQSAKMISEAIKTNPLFLELRKIEAAKAIASTLARAHNRVYLNSEGLMFNLLAGADISQQHATK